MSGAKLREQYDWIVLGDDPGALLSGCLAARLGLSVLILPLSPSLDVMSTKNDKFVDPESSLLLGVLPFEDSPSLLGRCLDQLGMREDERGLFIAQDALPQVLTPGTRAQLVDGQSEIREQLSREWGEEGLRQTGWDIALAHAEKEIRSFWTHLPESKMRFPQNAESQSHSKKLLAGLRLIRAKTRALLAGTAAPVPASVLKSARGLKAKDAQAARQWFSSQALTSGVHSLEFFDGVWSGLSGSAPRGAQKAHLLQLAGLRAGSVSVRGGMSAFRDLLRQLAKRNGADVVSDSECQAIFVQHGKFVGIQSQGLGGMISGGGAMLGVPFTTLPFVATGRGSGAAGAHPAPGALSGWKFTVAISVHPEAIPPGATRRIVWKEADAPFLEIELTRGRDYGFAENKANHSVIFARTLMPLTAESLTTQFQRLTAARMLRKLTEIFPFLDYHIEWIYPDFRGEDAREFRETYGFESVSAIPPNLRSYDSPGVGVRSSAEGLFLSSKESFPELGSFGYAVSAIEAVTWAARRAALPGPFVVSATLTAQTPPRE